MKTRFTGHLWGESTSISLHIGQERENRFHLMTSSCNVAPGFIQVNICELKVFVAMYSNCPVLNLL